MFPVSSGMREKLASLPQAAKTNIGVDNNMCAARGPAVLVACLKKKEMKKYVSCEFNRSADRSIC